jgi:magnesium transporter
MGSAKRATSILELTPESRLAALRDRSAAEAAEWLEPLDPGPAAELLAELGAPAVDIVWEMPPERRAAVVAAAPFGKGEQWLTDHSFPEGTVGRLMAKPLAVFRPETRVREAVEQLRDLVRRALVTYGFVTDDQGRLLGVLAFRELLFAEGDAPLSSLMHRDPFFLRPGTTLVDAMREVVTKHYPAYPVCDAEGRLIGMVRGQELFERQAFEISAQAGAMVGVEKEERLATPWSRSLRFRHPWLQLNLLTAFIAAAVVGFFQETLDRLVVLAVFLPVLAGQSGNTGCQSLAVTLRGMTLGELRPDKVRTLLGKEAWLGLLNGALVGLVAAAGMFFYSRSQGNAASLQLALVVLVAMTGACVASGLAGAAVPLTLKRLGADPATASSIFLTTATDVVSMGLFLGLATWLVR